ncbi:MAG: biotin-dependent carboxyltransferase [Clostridiaceae bacterium]|nr:biotin-dependent carboxyltransferase [Clostridiaceae bacterium]
MEFLKIINPGVLSTIQDLGRKGYQQYGIPVSGAMDPFALQAANLLVGNQRDEAGIEITYPGFEAEILNDCIIAVTGGDLGAKINGTYIPRWKSIYVTKGSRISFDRLCEGCRCYLAVGGGIQVPSVLGSKSTYLRGGFGGYKGRKLQKDDVLYTSPDNAQYFKYAGRRLPVKDIPKYRSPFKIRVILGPQHEHFTPESINTFLSEPYVVGEKSDRMGYRLEGPKLEHVAGADIISDGVPLGAIQVPGHGNPIIMLADRQTTGGYTKIATVISVDISLLAQCKPGDKIFFEEISIEEAHQLLRYQEQVLKQISEMVKLSEDRKFIITVQGEKFYVTVEEWK